MQGDELLSLISETAQGNKKAFSTLYEETSGKLFAKMTSDKLLR